MRIDRVRGHRDPRRIVQKDIIGGDHQTDVIHRAGRGTDMQDIGAHGQQSAHQCDRSALLEQPGKAEFTTIPQGIPGQKCRVFQTSDLAAAPGFLLAFHRMSCRLGVSFVTRNFEMPAQTNGPAIHAFGRLPAYAKHDRKHIRGCLRQCPPRVARGQRSPMASPPDNQGNEQNACTTEESIPAHADHHSEPRCQGTEPARHGGDAAKTSAQSRPQKRINRNDRDQDGLETEPGALSGDTTAVPMTRTGLLRSGRPTGRSPVSAFALLPTAFGIRLTPGSARIQLEEIFMPDSPGTARLTTLATYFDTYVQIGSAES